MKTCKCCHAVYSIEGWRELPHLGDVLSNEDGQSYCLELRQCPCQSTLGWEWLVPETREAA